MHLHMNGGHKVIRCLVSSLQLQTSVGDLRRQHSGPAGNVNREEKIMKIRYKLEPNVQDNVTTVRVFSLFNLA
jgi:hypothetical protein